MYDMNSTAPKNNTMFKKLTLRRKNTKHIYKIIKEQINMQQVIK